MGNNCNVEVAPAAISFETDATLNKKRAGLKVVYSVVVHSRSPIGIKNFTAAVTTMLESRNDPVSRKEIFLSKDHSTAAPVAGTEISLNSGKTSLNSTSLAKNVRIGKPDLSVSYSWSDRRTARKEEAEKLKKTKSRKAGSRRQRRKKRKKKKPIQDSTSEEEEDTNNNKPRRRKWKKLVTPRRSSKRRRRRRRRKKKNQSDPSSSSKKKRPPLPLYAPVTAATGIHKKIFPRNRHPVQIQFIEECPASVDLCVIFNSNTATHKFTAGGETGPFRTTGGQRRIHRAADQSCFAFSDTISSQKKHYNHCFSVEFQMGNVRYVTHFQEVDRVVLLWAKEINGLYHGNKDDDDDDDENKTLINVPVLLCLPQQQNPPQITSQFRRRQRQPSVIAVDAKEKMETMDLMICDSKSIAWVKHRQVQLFPVRQIKAADIQAYMNQTQRDNEDGQSSCSDAASLTRKKKKQEQKKRRGAKKKRNRSRFWQRSRAPVEKVTQKPIPTETKESMVFGPPPGLDLVALRRVTKAVHPGIKGLTSLENSPRSLFTLTDSKYSVTSSSSPSASISSSSSKRLSQPSSPSGETTIESFSMTATTTGTVITTTGSDDDDDSGSSWFTDSQETSPYELEEEEEESSAAYIQLPKDSTNRIISDSIETASSISATSSSSWNHRQRHHRRKKKKRKTPVLNLKPITTQREILLEGIAQKMKKEIQKTENPQKTSPRFHSRILLSLEKINPDQETIESSSGNDGYNALLSPRSDLSPRLWKKRREEILRQAQQKKKDNDDGDDDEKIQQKQREHLVELLNQKEEKQQQQLEKSPREKLKKFGRTLVGKNHRKRGASLPPPPSYASDNCLRTRRPPPPPPSKTKPKKEL